MSKIEKLDAAALVQCLINEPAPAADFVFTKRLQTRDVVSNVKVRTLPRQEQDDALKSAQDYAKEKGELDGYSDIYNEAQALEICHRILCHPELGEREDGTKFWRPMFTSPDHMRQAFNAADCAQILNFYEIVKHRFGDIEAMDDAEFDVWTARVSDALVGAHFLSRLDSSHWVGFIFALCQQVRELREEVGRPLLSWQATFESDQQNSRSTTGEFTELPAASSSNGVDLPQDRYLGSLEAAKLAAEIEAKGDPKDS